MYSRSRKRRENKVRNLLVNRLQHLVGVPLTAVINPSAAAAIMAEGYPVGSPFSLEHKKGFKLNGCVIRSKMDIVEGTIEIVARIQGVEPVTGGIKWSRRF